MIKFNNNKISVYKGAYKPVDLQKNAKNLGGYFIGGTNENEAVFDGTYDDYLTLYGKSDYLISPNLCPNLKPQSGAINEYSWQIIPNSDGTFNFSGAMVTGETVGRVTLPAGTYTASGCKYLQLYWDGIDGFLTLPSTFTLSKETTILLVFWYTETVQISLTNQYIQIEKGEQATEFCPYSGDKNNKPNPNNAKRLISSGGRVFTAGKNLLNISKIRNTSVTAYGGTLICNSDGGITGVGTPTNAVSFSGSNGLPLLYLPKGVYTLSVTGDFENIACSVYLRDVNGNRLHAFGVQNMVKTVKFNTADFPNYSYVTFEIKRADNDVEMSGTAYFQLEKGSKATGYIPFFGSESIQLPKLYGIKVSKNTPKVNYIENGVDFAAEYYISDCYKANKHIRNIGNTIFTGNEQDWIEIENHGHTDIAMFSIPCSNAKVTKNAICSHFNYVDDIFETVSAGDFTNDITSQNNFVFAVQKDIASCIDEWLDWLSKQNSDGTPVTVYYVLNQPKITAEYIKTDISYKPKIVKTFARYTNFQQTPDKGCLGYGVQKAIKIKQ